MRFLKTNTAVIVTVGPFYDKTDGVTIEGSLTITNERITLVADTDAGSAPTIILDNITGATSGTANDLNYITGIDAGLMQLELAAADVNRLGRLMLTITDAANHVPVFHEFTILPAAVYDSLILGSLAQPGQGAPPAATDPFTMIAYLFKGFRNRVQATTTAYKLYNDDATTVDQKATVSDDGTTFERTEIVSGP